MKTFSSITSKVLALLFSFYFTSLLNGQNLSLNDLHNMFTFSNWTDCNDFLVQKGWEFSESSQDNLSGGRNCSIITYAHSISPYENGKAIAWINLLVFQNKTEKIIYSATESAFKNIKSSLVSYNYKLYDSQISNNSIYTEYQNNSFLLEIRNQKEEDNYKTKSYVLVTKKGGAFDTQNGDKTTYDTDGNIKEKYTLKNGKIVGEYYSFYKNGNIKQVVNFVNDVKTGNYFEYNEDGQIQCSATYKNDKLEGKYTHFEYTDGKVFLKDIGNYKDGLKEGYFETQIYHENKWKPIAYINYRKDIANGDARIYTGGDTIIFCSFLDGKLHGNFQVKSVVLKLFNPVFMNDNDLITLVNGEYNNGKKTGHWKRVDSMFYPIEEGDYDNDLKNGTWKYYRYYLREENSPQKANIHIYKDDEIDITDSIAKGPSICYQLDHLANYRNGELHGYYIKFKEKTILKTTFNDSIDFICYYRNGKRDGKYEKHDNMGNIVTSGSYSNGEKNGVWMEKTLNGKTITTYFNNNTVEDIYLNDILICQKVYENKILTEQQWFINNQLFLKRERVNSNRPQITIYTTKDNYSSILNKYNFNNYKNSLTKKEMLSSFLPDSMYLQTWLDIADGKIIVFDSKKRVIVDGEYKQGKMVGNWTIHDYDRNLMYQFSCPFSNLNPKVFYINDGKPFSGVVTYDTISYSIKKSIIKNIKIKGSKK